jgi:hypothetical protein
MIMINIVNSWFAFQAPRRADLSGRPFGFLFIWLPHKDKGKFSPLRSGFRIGFYLDEYRKVDRPRRMETINCGEDGWYEIRRIPMPRIRFGEAA